jgi:hypothetical protein
MKIRISDDVRNLLLAHRETSELAELILHGPGGLVVGGEQDIREDFRDACQDLLTRIGFDDNFQPTREGALLENLIEQLCA